MTTNETPVPRGEDRRKSDRRAAADQKDKKPGINIWIVLSFCMTAIIIGWGFSLPFRKHERPLLIWDESDIPRGDLVRKVRLSKAEADAYRAAAIQRDREFLRERRDRLRNRAPLPGAEDAQAAEQKRVASMKKKIMQLRDAPEESLEGEYRKELIEKLKAPQ